ncbi:hypothetical protein EVAR_59393_1 [Eumeta japonica]|uniref:Uncharacterized protein n=1 Tax=Eumeta variegata TaxID=151549 RepID=A0A4C1YL00_EUMVA|nr:hypothetical protein EVAR_59393_1 [Eumeta japonica]
MRNDNACEMYTLRKFSLINVTGSTRDRLGLCPDSPLNKGKTSLFTAQNAAQRNETGTNQERGCDWRHTTGGVGPIAEAAITTTTTTTTTTNLFKSVKLWAKAQ